MKIIFRVLVFIVSIVLMIWLLCPLYKGVVHIGMLYPLPFLALFAYFALKPNVLVSLFEKHRIIMIIATSLIGVGVIIFGSLVGVMLSYSGKTDKKDATVVVLGCQVTGETPSLMLYDRMMAAIEYIEQNPNSYVIASGGQGPGESVSEAQAIHDFLVKQGVVEERIFIEDKSTNTKENIAFSAEIIKEKGIDNNIVIVTDGFHQYRAAYFSNKNGIESLPYSCNTRWYFSFSYYSREVLAIIKMLLF